MNLYVVKPPQVGRNCAYSQVEILIEGDNDLPLEFPTHGMWLFLVIPKNSISFNFDHRGHWRRVTDFVNFDGIILTSLSSCAPFISVSLAHIKRFDAAFFLGHFQTLSIWITCSLKMFTTSRTEWRSSLGAERECKSSQMYRFLRRCWQLGSGRMIAAALAANGAKVYIGSRRGEVVEDAAKESSKLAGKIIPWVSWRACRIHMKLIISFSLELDISDKDSIKAAVKRVADNDGKLDLLYNKCVCIWTRCAPF